MSADDRHIIEFELAHIDLIAIFQPPVGYDVRAVFHAEAAGTLDHVMEEKEVVAVGSLDWHVEARLHLGGAGHVVHVAMGQPNLLDRNLGLRDRTLDVRQVASRINDHGTICGVAPQKGAVLLKRRDRNDETLRLGHGWWTPSWNRFDWRTIAAELAALCT